MVMVRGIFGADVVVLGMLWVVSEARKLAVVEGRSGAWCDDGEGRKGESLRGGAWCEEGKVVVEVLVVGGARRKV